MPKIIQLNELNNIINSKDMLVFSMAASEPQETIQFLKNIDKPITVINCLAMSEYPKNDNISVKSLFLSGFNRNDKNTKYIPTHLSQASQLIIDNFKPYIYIGTGVLLNDHEVSLSLSNVYELETFHNATIKIIEISEYLPITFGSHKINYDDIDYIIKSDQKPKALIMKNGDERDKKIGQFIADLIEDGSTIQLGIGSIPNEVAKKLVHKKNLGIHTEMFSDGLMHLVLSGAANGNSKTIHSNKHVCSFALGSPELYKFLNKNEDVLFLEASYVNNSHIIAKNHKQISINTTIEIDLYGQCNSESKEHTQYSGTGGQVDTAVGAQKSIGGKSFIALHSTAEIINKNGIIKKVSKIVSKFQSGSITTLSRNDIDYVVTEYGVAKLKGLTTNERAHALIQIAHPDFRENLENEFKNIQSSHA